MAKSSKKSRKRNSKNYASGNCKPKRRKAAKRKTAKRAKKSSTSRIFKAKGSGYCAVKKGRMIGCDMTKAEATKKAGL